MTWRQRDAEVYARIIAAQKSAHMRQRFHVKVLAILLGIGLFEHLFGLGIWIRIMSRAREGIEVSLLKMNSDSVKEVRYLL